MTDDQDFDALLERSSLGSPGARRLRASTLPARAAVVRRITELRNIIAHADRAATRENALQELTELLHSLEGSTAANAFIRAAELLRDWGIDPHQPERSKATPAEPGPITSVSIETELRGLPRRAEIHVKPAEGNGQQSDPVMQESGAIEQLPVDFAAFFTSEHPAWLRYAHQRLGHRADAEDAVQNAGLVLYRRWARALSSQDLRAFAFDVVEEAVHDVLRQHARIRRNLVDLGLEPISELPGQESTEIDQFAKRDLLARAMARLAEHSPIQAEVVRLRQTHESYHDIAELLGITQTTARTYYSLGCRSLEHLLLSDDA
ncbi:RNA polymerase sigma factor [Kitasatospora sp. NPDC059722]|uniref:RNA polymerase sigma factor n=1 Tax=Kitasatospora sp. NPDC059722 TaxID=3346925 RepID=UPI0036BE156C